MDWKKFWFWFEIVVAAIGVLGFIVSSIYRFGILF